MKTGFFYVIKTKNPLVKVGLSVGPLGLEPRKTAPKTVVLPLHHGPKLLDCGCKFILFFI